MRQIILLPIVFMFVGCVTATELSKKTIMQKATFDLSCSKEKVQVISTGDKSFGATGCGKKAQYVCPRYSDECFRN